LEIRFRFGLFIDETAPAIFSTILTLVRTANLAIFVEQAWLDGLARSTGMPVAHAFFSDARARSLVRNQDRARFLKGTKT
jgi:hypothetical protein